MKGRVKFFSPGNLKKYDLPKPLLGKEGRRH